jgi:PIN domain nuclease of toxin-antitoxin system
LKTLPNSNFSISVTSKNEITIKVKKGDINLDGKVNMTDLIKLRKYQAGLEKLNAEALINADVNSDGKVNMTDIIKLRTFFAGLEDIK